jgi:hypothetical protein
VSHRKYYCKPLTEKEFELWNHLVEGSEGGTVFHQTHWSKSASDPFVVLGCFDKNDALVGGMPVSSQRLAGLRTMRPPYLTPYWGPVTFRTHGKYHRVLTIEKDIALALMNYLQASYDFVRTPLPPGYVDIQSFKAKGFEIDVENTYVIDLDDLDRVWKELDQGKRRRIRKSSQEGLTCGLSNDLDQFIPLLRHSLAAHSKHLSPSRVLGIQAWYETLSAANQARFIQVKDSQGRLCAGAVLVWDQRRAYYLLSGMDREISNSNSMTLLLWECIRFSSEELHLREFDFDGSEVPSVEAFFRGFGGRLIPRFSASWGRRFVWPIRRAHLWLAAVANSRVGATVSRLA